jgi:hypothetical protein
VVIRKNLFPFPHSKRRQGILTPHRGEALNFFFL